MTPFRATFPTRPLFLAAALLAVEGLVALGFGVVEVTQIRVFRLVVGAGTALLMLSYGAFLLAVARAIGLGRRWSRGPAVATQLLLLPIAWSFRGGQTWAVALSLATASIVTLACILAPSSTAVLAADSPSTDGSPNGGR